MPLSAINNESTVKMEKKISNAKREKLSLQEFEQQIKEIRAQFSDQLRCLESRTESQVALIGELQEFFRRKAEVEAEFSKSLEKLAKSILQKHKNEKQRRESWNAHSGCSLWQQLVDDTKNESKQRAIAADIYANHLVPKLNQRIEDIQRMSKKCRDIGSMAHGEISRVLSELHTAMKTYQLCCAQSASVEAKFRVAEQSKIKYESSNPSKVGTTRKYRALDRDYEKKHLKYQEFKLKALKARNEYLLCVDAANAALHKYFADDLSDLIDCMDIGVQHWLGDLISAVVGTRKSQCQHEMDSLAELCGFKDNLDAKVDKQKFFEANHSTFMLPKRFEFRPYFGDDMRQLSAQRNVQDELVQRFRQIEKRLASLKFESDEVWKTLETAEKRVLELQTEPQPSLGDLFAATSERKSCKESDLAVQKRKQDLVETEDFYLSKFHHYLLNANLILRLEARYGCIGNALKAVTTQQSCNGHHEPNIAAINQRRYSHEGSSTEDPPTPSNGSSNDSETSQLQRPPSLPPKPRKKRIGATASTELKRPRLFGGSLEEYVEATGEDIPLIMRSCVRMLTLFGLHHQGVFRVSGSQLEINAFKESFEKGEDPLFNCIDASDVNSVAGVLKLYLRELREPLFPIFMFDQFTECAKYPLRIEFLNQVQPLIASLSKPVQLVLRYLFAFLNHLSEFSDENMMDPYNLAICFGPTLLPIPEGKDQVFYHNFVNELVKNLIIFYEDVFDWNLEGPQYEKYLMADENLYTDEGEVITCTENENQSTTFMLESVLDSLPAVDEDVIEGTDGSGAFESSIESPLHVYDRVWPRTAPIANDRPPVWTKQRTVSESNNIKTEQAALDDVKCYEKIWAVGPKSNGDSSNRQLNRLRSASDKNYYRLSLQQTTVSPPLSPIENGGRSLSTTQSPIASPRHLPLTNANDVPVHDGISPTSLIEIQSELNAVLSSLEQFSVPTEKEQPDLVKSTALRMENGSSESQNSCLFRERRGMSETEDRPPRPPKPLQYRWPPGSTTTALSCNPDFEMHKF